MDIKYFQEIPLNALEFLDNLAKKDLNFNPVIKSPTLIGTKLNMGYLCYAIKIHVLTNNWNNLNTTDQQHFIEKLKNYQKSNYYTYKNYFIDDHLYKYFRKPISKYKAKHLFKFGLNKLKNNDLQTLNTHLHKTINADNKQTISTLLEIKEEINKNPDISFDKFNGLDEYLNQYDWSKPWDAGAQFSSICMYNSAFNLKLEDKLSDFIITKLDSDTGSYFSRIPVSNREIINGAMKVITGLDWLEVKIHKPNKLIDFCLANKPEFEGCDLVDYIYVLYKCSSQTNYKKEQVISLMYEVLEYLKLLYHPSQKGFSYFEGKSQTHYYGINISKGINEPDIHGTVLSIWAIVMILESIEKNSNEYKVIKP